MGRKRDEFSADVASANEGRRADAGPDDRTDRVDTPRANAGDAANDHTASGYPARDSAGCSASSPGDASGGTASHSRHPASGTADSGSSSGSEHVPDAAGANSPD